MKLKISAVFLVLAFVLLACGGGRRTDSGAMATDSPEYLMNEGFMHLNQGQLDQAERKLLAAVRKNPQLFGAHNALGIIYAYRRDFSAALRQFRQVLNLNPDFFDAYNSLGMVYSEMGEFDLARENLLIAANSTRYRTPENAFANLALLESRLNRWEAALRYIDKGLELNKRFAPLHNLKGIVMENTGQLREAVRHFENAISNLVEPEPEYLFNLGRVTMKTGDRGRALDYLEKALVAAGDDFLKQEINKLIKSIQDGKQ